MKRFALALLIQAVNPNASPTPLPDMLPVMGAAARKSCDTYLKTDRALFNACLSGFTGGAIFGAQFGQNWEKEHRK